MPRDKDIDTRVEELERVQRRLAEEIDQLHRELRAMGVDVPELNPARPGRTRLSDEGYIVALRKSAAAARAAKTVGPGKGSVGDPETAERLRAEADEDAD